MPELTESSVSPIGLGDVIRQALGTSRQKRATWSPVVKSLDSDPSIPVNIGPDPQNSPINRMFATDVGNAAVNIVRNEDKTLKMIEALSVELMAQAARARMLGIQPTFHLREDMRLLFVAAKDSLPPTLLILDPTLARGDARRISLSIPTPPALGANADQETGSTQTPEERVRALFQQDWQSMATALAIAQPEVVVARRPRMEPQSVPSPLICVRRTAEKSTAGIYCRDAGGTLGVTACFHGTGPVGTSVTVDGVPSQVALADQLQDIVFIPLPAGMRPSPLAGVKGVMAGRSPAQHSPARFEGATTGSQDTHVIASDLGLVRNRPGAQQRLQTDPDTNRGDSGSALVDSSGWILGFAFQKTAVDDYPRFSDWIWASNALATLGLTPV